MIQKSHNKLYKGKKVEYVTEDGKIQGAYIFVDKRSFLPLLSAIEHYLQLIRSKPNPDPAKIIAIEPIRQNILVFRKKESKLKKDTPDLLNEMNEFLQIDI